MRVFRLIGRQAAMVVRRPSALRTVMIHHGPAFALSVLALAGSLLASLVPFPLFRCTFLRFTGYPCPTCGGTRAFIDCLAGEWMAALRECPVAVPLYFAVWIVLLWNLAALISRRSICVVAHRRLKIMVYKWALGIGSVLLLANWIYRLAEGLK